MASIRILHALVTVTSVNNTVGGARSCHVAILKTLLTVCVIKRFRICLFGSSMGGWIMLHVALALGPQVSGMIGIAAAPDFTRDLMWRDFTAEQRDTLNRDGVVLLDSEYDPDGYPVTKAFIEDGERNLVLENSIDINCPVRLIQGMLDTEVPWETAIRLSQALITSNVRVCLVKNGDHRLSDDVQLQLLGSTLEDVLENLNQCADLGIRQ